MALLEVKNARLYYATTKGIVRAVDDVSFELGEGETLAVVGESGSGKSTLAKLLVRVWERNVKLVDGQVILEGRDILSMPEEEFRREVRWRKIAMVPQASMNALNPVIRIGDQMIEPLLLQGLGKDEALKMAMDALVSVGLPRDIVNRYPHQLSGGMKQRVIIAMAIMAHPRIVILDEPTSALDVMTQANIMNLLKKLKWEYKLSYIFITHDLALASELADSVAIMYAGKIIEIGSAEDVYGDPRHPYTQGLIASVPTLRTDKKLSFIPGEVPSLISPPPGCRFHPRCPFYKDRNDLKGLCDTEIPIYLKIAGKGTRDHLVACWLYR
ncbi:ABC transporter ATP-binding protein [Vulcanisaeta thermophila]|uniref:ABC transporter ATP-binding protein n=1 Tax=Vulcanisaeta thermophila TaxID=867917 RepID=UPI000853CA24|nr:ABC transporter ATP-binding protein [Vulcanisaeta thermophila]